MVDFGQTLKELRKRSGLTQQQLAERLWITKSMVSYYEQSLRAPSPDVLIKIAAIFHVSTDYLLGVEKGKSLDVSGLDDEDIKAVQQIVERLKQKNKP
ncbi:MAG: helix-turn-helix transcriptional regulator [Ruminococcus sp.]|nr:helix-turn-helix transcriptional regulator [Ruminococcus sp.]